jgi:PiT family inorganic phosphate transporter
MSGVVIAAIIIALTFDFLNGMNDAANSIATVVSTKVLSPLLAVFWAASFNFIAVFIFGVHVATTIGKGIVEPSVINEYVILGALIGAVLWVFTCNRLGLPISVSHSLIGGLIGAALVKGGASVLIQTGINKVLLFIAIAPLTGMTLGFLIMVIIMMVFRNFSPRRVNTISRILQLVSSAVFSIGHGSNDAQKTIGIISILLFSTGRLGTEFYIPTWVIFASYSTIAFGTLFGGWKVIKTLGLRLTNLKPVQGFCAETAGAIAIIGSTLLGVPVSTTHTITGSILGVGLTKGVSSVRWGVATNIVLAWILTIPGTMVIGGGIYYIISLFLPK